MGSVFITGGRGDIGQAIVKVFQNHGYSTIAPNSAELDLNSLQSCETYMESFIQDPDVIIHCAGWNQPKPFEDISCFELEKSFRINVEGFFFILQKLIPSLKAKKRGHILFITSIYGFLAQRERSPYVMSKHALLGLVKTLSMELGPSGIFVNAISPGFIDTQMTHRNNDAKAITSLQAAIPLGYLGKPNDIAKAAMFLCSPDNTYITGHNLIIDGGFSSGRFQK